jgi:hypothetical protein
VSDVRKKRRDRTLMRCMVSRVTSRYVRSRFVAKGYSTVRYLIFCACLSLQMHMMGLLEALMTCTNRETHLMMGMGGNIRADA